MSNALFGGLTTEGVEEAQDRIGGFRIYDSGPYLGTIKAAYAGESANSKARSVTIIADLKDGGEYSETFWVTNKKDENFYIDKDQKKQFLAGFTIVDDICQVTCQGKSLTQMTAEDKVINIYDPEAKKELPKSVKMFTELLGKELTFGIVKELRNKQAKDSNGVYQDIPDSREENSVNKIFHYPSNLTVVEARRGVQTATFYGAWVERNKGQVRDRRSIKDGVGGSQNGKAGRPGMPPKASDSAPKTASLFGS